MSIALIQFNDKDVEELIVLQQYALPLHAAFRETDTIGHLDKHTVGVILPDTSAEGAKECIKKIINGHSNLPCTITTATYPDHLFQTLTAEDSDQDGPESIFLYSPLQSAPLEKTSARVMKRGLDVVGSIIAILLFAPLMLITALAIKGTSPGPIIFKQTRLGEKGVPFTFYKFRSMYGNVDDGIHRDYVTRLINGALEEINQGDDRQPLYKIKADPRITPLGRIIRKTSIDELPQLLNVLKGDMSLVGPRPPLPYEAEKYHSWHLRRIFEIKPGITGLWQVEGRSQTSFDEMVRLDLRYMNNWTLMLDLKILVKTIGIVLKSTGAV